MKKLFFLWVIIAYNTVEALQVSARATKHATMPVLLVGYKVTPADAVMHSVLKIVQKDLSFTRQFQADLTFERSLNSRLWQKKYPIIAVVTHAHADRYAWQLYDGMRKKIIAQGSIINQATDRAYAHALADAMWKELTGSDGFFSTRIAYCKEMPNAQKIRKHIYIADYDGSNEYMVIDDPEIAIAPRWNRSCMRPLLFYSEFTDANVRMMYVDMHKNKHIACDFNGTSMLPTFSADGKNVIFCASNGNGTTQLYTIIDGKAQRLTHNSGNNFCPTLTEDGKKVYFCSDCSLSQPSLFVYDIPTKKLDRIAQTAGCETPCYCPANKRVAYCRNVKGVMQLFVYDTVRNIHKQLTECSGSKQGASWSPCGNYLVYAGQNGSGKNKLYMMHANTKRVYPLQSMDGNITYPNWSPRYERYIEYNA